jgi:DNA-binding transcriptional ArsR family regulator
MSGTQVNLMFRAFSDRTRLRILHLLSEGELCVGDLVGVLRVPQPTASRHLAYLRRAGLVVTRKNGRCQAPAVRGLLSSLVFVLDMHPHTHIFAQANVSWIVIPSE